MRGRSHARDDPQVPVPRRSARTPAASSQLPKTEPRTKTEQRAKTEPRTKTEQRTKVEQRPGSIPCGRQMHLTTPAP
eukprot:7235764-Prorocentrum_lima.AAC.1